MVQAPAFAVAFITELFGKTTSIEVRATFAVFVNQTAIGEGRTVFVIQFRRFAVSDDVRNGREEVVRVRRAARNIDNGFAWLKENNPGARLNEAYSGLPVAEVTPREAYNAIVDNNVELVSIENLPGRIAANSVIPYPPGIPMLLSGENFGDKNSPQVSYLRSLQSWDHHFPGFEHETEGTEIIDGIYHVMCVKA